MFMRSIREAIYGEVWYAIEVSGMCRRFHEFSNLCSYPFDKWNLRHVKMIILNIFENGQLILNRFEKW